MKIREILHEKNPSNYARFLKLEDVAREELSRIQIFFPNYTDHGINHSTKLEEILDALLDDKVKSNLNEDEIFYLLVATLFHDVGMIGDLGDEKNENKLIEIRETHHERSRDYIISKREELGLDPAESEIISGICYAHRGKDSVDIQNEFLPRKQIKFKNISERFLCACLRLADECHLTYDRIEELEKRAYIPIEEKEQVTKHLRTLGVAPSPGREIIEISCTVDSERTEELVRRVQDKLQYELDGLRDILEAKGVVFSTMKLNLNETTSYKLFKSGITDKILIQLMDQKERTAEKLAKEIGQPIRNVQIILSDLVEANLVIDAEERYKISEDMNTFVKLARELRKRAKIGKYIESEYFLTVINRDEFKEFIENRFWFDSLNENDFKPIRQMVKHSPTVLDFLIDSDASFFENIATELERLRSVVKKEKIEQKIQKLESDRTRYFMESIVFRFIFDMYLGYQSICRRSDIRGVTIDLKNTVLFEDKSWLEVRAKSPFLFVKAEGAFKKGQLMKPKDINSLIYFSNLFIEMGIHPEAIRLLDSVLSSDLENRRDLNRNQLKALYTNKGLALMRLGKYFDAIECCDAALKLDNNLKEAWINKGMCLFYLKDFDNAINCFDNVLKIESQNLKGFYWKASSLKEMGEFDFALSILDQIPKETIDTILLKGEIFFEKRAIESAAKVYQQVLEQQPITFNNIIKAYFGLGQCYYEMGKSDDEWLHDAMVWFDTVVRLIQKQLPNLLEEYRDLSHLRTALIKSWTYETEIKQTFKNR